MKAYQYTDTNKVIAPVLQISLVNY